MLYKATKYGFQVHAFNTKCYNITNTVTDIKNKFNYVFGGFTAAKWSSAGVYIDDPNAFRLIIN